MEKIVTRPKRTAGGTREADLPNRWGNSNAPTIDLHEIPIDSGILRRHEPLVLHPYLSPCQKYFSVQFDDIDMELTDVSIADLKGAIEAVLRMDWRDYAMGNPDTMTQGAQGLRNRLLALYSYESAE